MYNIHSSKIKNSEYKRNVYINDKLEIETYIIGYRTEGESILFFIKADGCIHFSGLVDYYQLKQVNIVEDILIQNGVSELDFICWTHPDYDHSKGLKDTIKTYASEKTYIWIPEGVDESEIKFSSEVEELFLELKECVLSNNARYNVYSVSDKKDLTYYNSINFQKDADMYPLSIISYAPSSKLIRRQNYMEQFIKNDRSIFFVLALGDVRIFLTGDIEDETIRQIPRGDFVNHIHIMKIPHHGSTTSVEMLGLGIDDCDVACSTVYRKGKQNLPVDSVLDQYANNSWELYCTGRLDGDKEEEPYGIVKIVTNVIEKYYSVYKEGNACLLSYKSSEEAVTMHESLGHE